MVPSQTQADTQRMRAHRSFATGKEDPLRPPWESFCSGIFLFMIKNTAAQWSAESLPSDQMGCLTVFTAPQDALEL